jgi:thiamine-monophosphate kinase
MIDTSDGFLGDLGHICEESVVGAELFKEKLPVSEALREAAFTLQRDPYDFLLGDSDDYELVMTCRPQDVTLLRSVAVRCCPVPLTEVGRITDRALEITLLLPGGERRPVKPSGWDHFRLSKNSGSGV